MKCPQCKGTVRFPQAEIICPKCGWQPPDAVMNTYRLVPLTNRRIAVGSALLVAFGLATSYLNGDPLFLLLGLVGLAYAPLLIAGRSWIVNRMMRDCQID